MDLITALSPSDAASCPRLAEVALRPRIAAGARSAMARPGCVALVGSYTIVTFRGWLIEDSGCPRPPVFACAPELVVQPKRRFPSVSVSCTTK